MEEEARGGGKKSLAKKCLLLSLDLLSTTFTAPITEHYLIGDEVVLCNGRSKGGGEERRRNSYSPFLLPTTFTGAAAGYYLISDEAVSVAAPVKVVLSTTQVVICTT